MSYAETDEYRGAGSSVPGNGVTGCAHRSAVRLKWYVFCIIDNVNNRPGRNRHPDTGKEVRTGQKYVLIQNRKAGMADI